MQECPQDTLCRNVHKTHYVQQNYLAMKNNTRYCPVWHRCSLIHQHHDAALWHYYIMHMRHVCSGIDETQHVLAKQPGYCTLRYRQRNLLMLSASMCQTSPTSRYSQCRIPTLLSISLSRQDTWSIKGKKARYKKSRSRCTPDTIVTIVRGANSQLNIQQTRVVCCY